MLLAMFIWILLHSVFCRCLGDGAGWSSGAWILQILGRWDFSVQSKKCSKEKKYALLFSITWIVCRYFGLEKCNFCLRHEKLLFCTWKRPQFFPGVNYELVSQNKKCCAGGSTSSCSRCPSDPPHCTGGEHRSFEVFTWSLVFRCNCVATVFLCRRFHTSILTSSLTCSRWINQSLPNATQAQMMIIMFDEYF